MKKMKLIFIALIFTLVLVGCNIDPDYEINGVTDSTIYVDDVFDILEGITATEDGDDITSDIVVYIKDVDGNTVEFNTDVPFVFYITYSITEDTDADEERIVTVLEVIITDTTPPVITGVEDITLETTDTYDPLDGLSIIDDIDGDITNSVTVTMTNDDGTVITVLELSLPGIKSVVYTITDNAGNESKLIIEVTIIDVIDPVITGVEDITIGTTDTFDPFEGLVVTDNIDGDIATHTEVLITNEAGTEIELAILGIPGDYDVLYIALDEAGNEATVTIVVTVVDYIDPVITAEDVTLDNDITIEVSDYATAMDNVDGNITDDITYTIEDEDGFNISQIDDVAGEYFITYTIIDSSGNESIKEITITLVDVIDPYFITLNDEFEFYIPNGVEFILSNYVLADDESDWDTVTNVESTFYDSDSVEITFDSSIEGIYTVDLVAFDQGVNYAYLTVTFHVGGIEPIPYDNGLVLAEFDLDMFYYEVILSSMTIEAICNLYVGDIPFNWIITYEECLEGLPQVRDMVTAYTIDSVVLTNPTEFIYTATVTLTVDGEELTFDVEFNFFSQEYGAEFVYYLNFITDPFMFGPMSIELTLVEAEAAIFNYYNDLIDPSYDITLFCNTYVMNTVNNEVTLQDCIDGVTMVRSYLDEFNIVTVTETVINPPEGDSFNGYVATITLATSDGTGDVDIYFGFFNVDGEPSLTLFGSPLGDDMGGPAYADITIVEAGVYIAMFYTNLTEAMYGTPDFCGDYVILGEDMQPLNTTACELWRNDVLTYNYAFTTGTVEYIAGQDGEPPVYIVDVQRVVGGVTTNFQAMFFFALNQDEEIMIMTHGSNAIGETELNMGGDGPAMADIDLATAEAMIAQYYQDAVDASITDAEFCAMYFTLATTMEPLDPGICILIRAEAVIDGFTFIAADVTFYEGQDGGPSYYEATITATKGTIFKEFKAIFIFIVGEDSNPMLATQLEVSFGNVFTLDTVPEDILMADTMINQFYQDLFDSSITNEAFCNTWIENNPLYIGTTADCLEGRSFALSRSEVYTLDITTVYESDPFIVYQITVTATLGIDYVMYEMYFFITKDGTEFYITLMTEIIVVVEPPM